MHYEQPRREMRRHSDVSSRRREQMEQNRRQNIRRSSYAVNEGARHSLSQIQTLRQNIAQPQHDARKTPNWRQPSEGSKRLSRADPAINTPKKITIILNSKPGLKEKLNSRCPSCKTKNVFEYTRKHGSSMAVQCFKCSLKFFLEIKTSRTDTCPKCSSKNQFKLPARSAKIRVQCYQCKFSFTSQSEPPKTDSSEDKSESHRYVQPPPNPLVWQVKDVQQWLRHIGMPKYTMKFEEEMIDGRVLLEDVDQKLLEDAFDIPRLHAKKIMAKIVGLRAECNFEPQMETTPVIPPRKKADHASLEKSKLDHLAKIRKLQEQKNQIELKQVILTGSDLEKSRSRKKQISKEIKKRLKKIKKIELVLKKHSKSRSLSSGRDPVETAEFDLGTQEIAIANAEKRRQSMVLDQQLAEKTRRLEAMEERLRASAAKNKAKMEVQKSSIFKSRSSSKKSEIKDDLYNFEDSESDSGMGDHDFDEDISDMSDSLSGAGVGAPTVTRNMSVSDRLFANLIGSAPGSPTEGEEKDPSKPLNWSADHVGEWLEETGFSQYAEDFSTMEVNGSVLLSHQVNERYLKNIIHVKEDHLKPLMAKINNLKLDHAPSLMTTQI